MAQLGRRSVLAGAAACALLPRLAFGESSSPERVQPDHDDAFDPRVWAPNAEEVLARQSAASAATRKRIAFMTQPYGITADEVLDIFPTERPNAPVHVFVHGGGWRGGAKEDVSFPASVFVPAGVIYIALDFANLPKVPLPDMVDQIGRAVAWTYKHAKGFGGDPERIFLSGHSSGAHLVAAMLTADWGAFDAPATAVKAALCISGLYDLDALPPSAWPDDAKPTPEERAALSPQRRPDRVRCPVTIAYGDEDGPGFQQQSRDFATALKDAGQKVEFAVAPGLNHFDILDTMGKPDGFLARMALKQIGVAA